MEEAERDYSKDLDYEKMDHNALLKDGSIVAHQLGKMNHRIYERMEGVDKKRIGKLLDELTLILERNGLERGRG